MGVALTLNSVAVKVVANNLTMMATSAAVPGSTVQTAAWAELGAPAIANPVRWWARRESRIQTHTWWCRWCNRQTLISGISASSALASLEASSGDVPGKNTADALEIDEAIVVQAT